MKKHNVLLLLPLISILACGCEFRVYPPSSEGSSIETHSVETTPSSETDSSITSHEPIATTVDTRSDSSESSLESFSEPSSESSSESSSEEVHAESLRVGLFEKMPKIPEMDNACALYPNSEFDLDYEVYPDNALEKDVVFQVNKDVSDIIDVAKGKIITKNKYSTTPFTITATVENTDIRIVQKVAVVPGEKFISLRLKEHFDATNYGERYQARNSYFKMFDTFNAKEDAIATNEMDVTYFENELTSIQRYRGEFSGKSTKRLDDNYFYDVRYKRNGTIDYGSYKYEFGEKVNQNQITRKSAEEQVNYPLFANNIYGAGNYFSYLTSTYESMGADNWYLYFDETLRFDVKEDSDSRFYADVAGKKSVPNSTDIVYVNAIFDVRFDSYTRIGSFKHSVIYTFNEDPTKTSTFNNDHKAMTFVANIYYADKKNVNPIPDDFSEIGLKPTTSKEVANRLLSIANGFNEIETKKVQRIRTITNLPGTLSDTYLIEYYKNETIEEETAVNYTGGDIETESFHTKQAKAIRDGKLYELTFNSKTNKYIVDKSTVIGTAEGQISQEDAIYEANHCSYIDDLLKNSLQFGLESKTITELGYEIVFDNIKTGIRADTETSFSYYCNYLQTATNDGDRYINWVASDVELSFVKDATNGEVLLSGFRYSTRSYAENPFNNAGDLKDGIDPTDTVIGECTIEYYPGDTKDENPNPIEFSIDETSTN